MKEKKKHLGLKILCIVLLGITVIALSVIAAIYKMQLKVSTGERKISDYDKKIEIWDSEKAPGNSKKRKLDSMKINYDAKFTMSSTDFYTSIIGEKYIDVEEKVDTYTYFHAIKPGYEKETYEDVPYLIPYLVEESDSAIIVIPGGGFAYKSIEDSDGEGKDIAEVLQKNGINAFVLNYRSNPYEYPIPQLDLQRAVRYIKYHAEEYGIDTNKIGLIGFSAGGFQVGSYINLIQGNNFFEENYIPDEIDLMDDSVAAPAMIYPTLTFNYNVGMLFSIENTDKVKDENKRQEILELFDLKRHLEKSKDLPQFISYGTEDIMVGSGPKEYVEAAKEKEINVTEVVAENARHVFEQKYYMEEYLTWVKNTLNKNQKVEV